jgi:hypothetical protein
MLGSSGNGESIDSMDFKSFEGQQSLGGGGGFFFMLYFLDYTLFCPHSMVATANKSICYATRKEFYIELEKRIMEIKKSIMDS